MNILNRMTWDKHTSCCWADTQSRKNWQCMLVLTRVLPGCVWDWSHPTLWLLLREILRADWCLVARRLGHLGRGRHCWGRILIWVKEMDRKVQGNILPDCNHFAASLTKNNHHKICVKLNTSFKSKRKSQIICISPYALKSAAATCL